MKKLMQKLGYLFLVVLAVAMSLSGCLTAVAHADDGVDAQAAIWNMRPYTLDFPYIAMTLPKDPDLI